MLLIIVDFSYHSSSSLYHYPPASTGLLFLPYTSEALSFVPVYLLFSLLSIYYLLSTIYFSTIYYHLTSHPSETLVQSLPLLFHGPPKLSSSFWLHFLECQYLLSLSWWPLWPCTARGAQRSVGDNTGKASSWGRTEEGSKCGLC